MFTNVFKQERKVFVIINILPQQEKNGSLATYRRRNFLNICKTLTA